MLQIIWCGIMLFSIAYALVTGNGAALLPAALSGAQNAIALTLKLAAGYAFFCGMIEIMQELGVQKKLARLLSPALGRLFPSIRDSDTSDAIVLNFSANLLGLGNAATPMGIRAMQSMDRERAQNPAVKNAMFLFLVINATSLQLLPTTVLSLRVAAGSANPTAILLPTLLCTLGSTVLGVSCALICQKLWGERDAIL